MFAKKPEKAASATEHEDAALTFYDAGKDYDLMKLHPQNKELFANMPEQRAQELQNGAIAAFREGHPENIQTLLAHPDLFPLNIPPQQMLCNLTKNVEDSEDKAAVILVAIDKIPEEQKQKFLDKTLSDVFTTVEFHGEEPFITALITVGADANAVIAGAPGRAMAMAVTNGYPQTVIGLLHENGAKFEDALLRIQTKPFWDKDNRRELAVHKLKTYREAITGEPAVQESDVAKELGQLRAEIAALRDELTRRLPDAPKAAPKKKPAASKPKSGENPSL